MASLTEIREVSHRAKNIKNYAAVRSSNTSSKLHP